MDFEFPPDTLMLREMLRRFVQKEARPLEPKYFTSGELSPEERRRLRQAIDQMGLWGLMVPDAFGGGGLDLVTACMIEEELGRTFIPVELGDVFPLLYACVDKQVARYLEPALAGVRRAILAAREPGEAGIHPEDWQTVAVPKGDGFVINGRKSLTTVPSPDDFFILFSHLKETQETLPAGLTAFLLDANSPGLDVSTDGEYLLEIRACHTGNDAILGEPGRALALDPEEAARVWIRMGARYVGIVERLIEMAVEHAKDWVSLGAPLAVRPAIRRMLAEMRVDVESTRWLVYHAAWMADHKNGFRDAAAQVRLATSEMLKRAVNRITMIFTGPGPSPQIEPHYLVRSAIPPGALELTIERARAEVAAGMLDLSGA